MNAVGQFCCIYIPAGAPKPYPCHLTANIPARTRNSRLRNEIRSRLPPWLLTIAIFRTPARATDSPNSTKACNAVAADKVKVFAANRCSFDAPIAYTGRIRAFRSAGQLARNFANIPCLINMSVPTGKCSACCSVAAIGKTAITR